ncbi:MAG TPA: NADH-quinone oxidoreductase subunit J [candidate division Zixibacteria bacterium]|nr:NADH-quinone oxidoreductase subunit J [candidate division Zixibacteria bacterium]
MVVSAFLAIWLDNAVYSVAALTGVLVLVAILYSLNDAGFAAVFQLGISMGTLAVLFLSGETLTEKTNQRKPLKKAFLAVIAAILLSLPSLLISVGTPTTNASAQVSFPQALWNLRAVDIVLQGLVIMTVALGIAIVLHVKKEKNS